MEADLALAQRGATFVFNLAVAWLVGASAATLWLRQGRSSWASAQLARLRKTMLASALLAAAAYAAILWLEAASMAEVPVAEAFPALRSVLAATHYGVAWMIGAGALLLVALCSAMEGAMSQRVRVAALGVLLYSRSMVSHAGAGGDLSWAVAVDWVHLVLIGIWLGEVLVAGLLTLRAAPQGQPQEPAERARYIEALSRSATIALAGIVATGVVSALRGLGGIGNVVGNPYGTTLLVKLGLVAGAAALGGLNRFTVMPALLSQLRASGATATDAHRRFARILHIEAVLLVAVLLAAAFLSSTPPPAHGS